MSTKQVTIYSTPTCHYCTLAKQFFDASGVSYQDKNVALDRSAAQEMIMKSGQMGVPVIDIEGSIVVGFQPNIFEQLLKK